MNANSIRRKTTHRAQRFLPLLLERGEGRGEESNSTANYPNYANTPFRKQGTQLLDMATGIGVNDEGFDRSRHLHCRRGLFNLPLGQNVWTQEQRPDCAGAISRKQDSHCVRASGGVLVTGPDGSILANTVLGDQLLIQRDDAGTAKDSNRIFY